MAKLSRRGGLQKKETREEIVARLKGKKASGEKLTWGERCQLYWVSVGIALALGIPFTAVVLAILDHYKIINIF